MGVTRATRKGQITIPKDVRDSLGISAGDYVVVVMDGGRAILWRAKDEPLAALRGRLPATRPYPGLDEVRRQVGQDLGKRAAEQDQ